MQVVVNFVMIIKWNDVSPFDLVRITIKVTWGQKWLCWEDNLETKTRPTHANSYSYSQIAYHE